MRGWLLLALALLLGCESVPVDEGVDPEPPEVVLTVDLTRWDPQFYRADELSLSGEWKFAFDPDADGEQRGLYAPGGEVLFDRTILVPYPWQAVLSGLGPEPPNPYPPTFTEQTLQTYKGVVWYARRVEVPASWPADERVFLRFGAVDWEAEVWVEGERAAGHVGGYTPFEVDVTAWAQPGGSFHVAVRVRDDCYDDKASLVGKQGGFWYTCAGGLWQDVVLSHRPAAHVVSVLDLPADDHERVSMVVDVTGPAGPATLSVAVACIEESCGRTCGPEWTTTSLDLTGETVEVPLELAIPGVVAWTPEQPCLLGRTIELTSDTGTDAVLGYTAVRDIRVDWAPGHSPADSDDPGQQYKAFYVAGRPVYVRGVLDQGYHPQGIHQYPSRDARLHDLQLLQELGFNTVRQHIKPEEPYFYAACDLMGLIVIYDLPCPPDLAPSSADAQWKPAFEQTLRDLIARDRNHPSILWWVVFNEAWGLMRPPFWKDEDGLAYVAGMVELTRLLDPFRPAEDNSPGGLSEMVDRGALPHVATDVLSYHIYDKNPVTFGERIDVMVSETYPGSTWNWYGADAQAGQPLVISEFGGLGADDTDGDAGFLLHSQLRLMRAHPKIQGYVFTQAYDVEWEHNGLLRYDRSPKELGLEELGLASADLLGDPFLILGPSPIVTAEPGAHVELELGAASPAPLTLTGIAGELTTREGDVLEEWTHAGGEVAEVTTLGVVSLTAPADDGIYVVTGRAEADSAVVARAGLYLVVDAGDDGGVGTLRPDDAPVSAEFECAEGACWCSGACELVFAIDTPGPGRYRVSFEAELAAYDPTLPQTDGIPHPSTVTLFLDDGDLARFELEDAPDDHRGVLSLHNHYPDLRGSYGARVSVELGELDLGDAVAVRFAATDGVRLFFRTGGRYLLHPQLTFELYP